VKRLPSPVQVVLAVLEELRAGHVEAEQHVFAGLVAGLADRFENGFERFLVRRQIGREAAFVADRGAEATPLSTAFSAWKTSVPQRSASENEGAPTGSTMNSCRSTLLSACAPPLMMFIIGTGSTGSRVPPLVARCRHSGLPGEAPPHAHSPATRRAARWRRGVPLFSVPSSAISAGVEARLVGGIAAEQRRARSSPLTLATAFCTPLPR
jgi:hypothetical protein